MSAPDPSPDAPRSETDALIEELGVEAPTWGLVDPSVLERIVVVSPHFDDAVLGAAHVLATYSGSRVLTVFGGRPPAYPDPPTDWDAAGGFRAGDDVVAIRRGEDETATATLGATSSWLEFSDHQYLAPDDRPDAREVADALVVALEPMDPTAVFVPMGIANPDHDTTHAAALVAREALGAEGRSPVWFCYEDHGYKHLPGLLAWRVARLFRREIWPTPAVVPVVVDMDRKRAAIACYHSQIGPLERDHVLTERLDANVPEQYWRLAPPPRGWEGLIEFL
jgi:LmbE family N-acetylglucosaminyl deacetylase